MSIYRIVKSIHPGRESRFKVQRKGWIFWNDLKELARGTCPPVFRTKWFPSQEAAEEAVDKDDLSRIPPTSVVVKTIELL